MSNINNATAATAKQPTKPKSTFRKFTEEEKQAWKAQKIAVFWSNEGGHSNRG